tara:strand:- start:43 stop:735 length:693 start_codon:yes stop_codon:yes gene_type:complete
MNEYTDFKTFLSISSNKLGIYLIDTKNHNALFEKEFDLEKKNRRFDFNILDKFLKENIFKIEKLIKQFVKNIFLIIDNEKIINHTIGIKKKNLNTKYLTNTISEVKDLFNKNYNDYKIMHIVINKILIDGNYHPTPLNDIDAKEISLEITFIAIPKEIVFVYDKILEKYQIKIAAYLNKNYIQTFCVQNKSTIASMAQKILNGYNVNEVKLVPKNTKKLGFFEKFFQLFS